MKLKLPEGLQVNLAQKRARLNLRVPVREWLSGEAAETPAASGSGAASNAWNDSTPQFASAEEVKPKESDFIYPRFRAISAEVAQGHCVDYSRPGVLEASAGLLFGQTVYKNHNCWDVESALGAISKAEWDGAGAEVGGVSGINVTLKIDALANWRIARLLQMTPPAIHSVSVTVVFEFEFSHPDLVEQGTFWKLLGQEVDGEIVRLIATKILDYWEISLVFQGAIRTAKKLADEEDELPEDDAGVDETKRDKRKMGVTVKLTAEQKAALGLTHEEDDVPEDCVLAGLTGLANRAAIGEKLLTEKRGDVKRLATLATLGSAEGQLPTAMAGLIDRADADELAELSEMYRQQAAERFPTSGRSSVEDTSNLPPADNAVNSLPPAGAF